jgi:hypothetical protein
VPHERDKHGKYDDDQNQERSPSTARNPPALTLALSHHRGAKRRGNRQPAKPAGGGRLERVGWGLIARPLEVCRLDLL